ncbi:hypothetical protein [Moraxella lacunata]
MGFCRKSRYGQIACGLFCQINRLSLELILLFICHDCKRIGSDDYE